MKKLVVILLVLILLGCSGHTQTQTNVTNVTPNEIMGMQKIVCLTGKAALELVKEMHIGRIEFVKDIALLHYVNLTNPKSMFVTVWVTLYPNSSVAKEETERMAKAMVGYGWKDVKTERVDGLKVYYVKPPDKNETQYFWCKGDYMIYIIPHNMTKAQVEEFIEAVSSRIP